MQYLCSRGAGWRWAGWVRCAPGAVGAVSCDSPAGNAPRRFLPPRGRGCRPSALAPAAFPASCRRFWQLKNKNRVVNEAARATECLFTPRRTFTLESRCPFQAALPPRSGSPPVRALGVRELPLLVTLSRWVSRIKRPPPVFTVVFSSPPSPPHRAIKLQEGACSHVSPSPAALPALRSGRDWGGWF